MTRLWRQFTLAFLACCCVAQTPKNVTYVRLHPLLVQQRVRVPAQGAWLRTLKRHFEESSIPRDQIREQAVPGEAQPNLICTLPGAGDGVIVVAARLDLPRRGGNAAIQWATLATLPLLSEAVNGVRTQNTYVFVAYADHKDTQAGMSWYLNRLGDEQRKKIRAVINVESIGRAGAIYQVKQRNAYLAKLLPKAAFFVKTQPPQDGLEIEKTALKVIEQAGVPAIVISSFATLGDFGSRVHLTRFDFKSYYETYNMLCVYLLYLDQTLGAEPDPSPEAYAAAELAQADRPEEDFERAAELQVLGLVNDERKSKGLAPLEPDKLLTRTARAHSSVIAKEKSTATRMFSGAEEVKTRFGTAGVRCIHGGEIVAVVREVDDASGKLAFEYSRLEHRKEILDGNHSVIGVGAVKANGNLYVTMDFATKPEFERKRPILTDESATEYLIEQIAARRKEAKSKPVLIAKSARLRDTLCDMARTNDQSTYRIRSLAVRRAEVYVAYGPDSQLLPEQMRVLATADASLISVAVCDAETSYWVAAIVNH